MECASTCGTVVAASPRAGVISRSFQDVEGTFLPRAFAVIGEGRIAHSSPHFGLTTGRDDPSLAFGVLAFVVTQETHDAMELPGGKVQSHPRPDILLSLRDVSLGRIDGCA